MSLQHQGGDHAWPATTQRLTLGRCIHANRKSKSANKLPLNVRSYLHLLLQCYFIHISVYWFILCKYNLLLLPIYLYRTTKLFLSFVYLENWTGIANILIKNVLFFLIYILILLMLLVSNFEVFRSTLKFWWSVNMSLSEWQNKKLWLKSNLYI